VLGESDELEDDEALSCGVARGKFTFIVVVSMLLMLRYVVA
jgi:hypothetical protein